MNSALRKRIEQARKAAAQARELLVTMPPAALAERAADFCECAHMLDDYAKRAGTATGAELADIMFCMGGLVGSLDYQIYELTERQEARRQRNRRLAHLHRIKITSQRYEELRVEYGSNEAQAMLAEELTMSQRQVANRLAFVITAEQEMELAQAAKLPWFSEYARLMDRYLSEQDENNLQ